MKGRLAVALVCGAVLAVGGCATSTPADLEYAQSARRLVAETLEGFAKAMSSDNTAAAMSFVDPQMPEARKLRLERALGQISWMTRYSDYNPDIEAGVASLNWQALKRGFAEVRLYCQKGPKQRYEDRYVVVRRGERWFVGGMQMPKIRSGEPVDPPEEEARSIRQQVKFVFDNLKEGRPGRVYAAMPKEDLSSPVLQDLALGLVTGGREPIYSVYEDLQIMQGFEIRNWPDPDRELPIIFLAPTVLVARYNIPYTWAEGGIYTTDNLRFDIYLVYDRGTWKLSRLRLACRGLG